MKDTEFKDIWNLEKEEVLEDIAHRIYRLVDQIDLLKTLISEDKSKGKIDGESAEELINDLYPAIAGIVIAAQKTGETNAEKMWNGYCRRMIRFFIKKETKNGI